MGQCTTISSARPNWSTLEFLTIALLVGSAILEGAAFLALSI
jgi:hypothetical protein